MIPMMSMMNCTATTATALCRNHVGIVVVGSTSNATTRLLVGCNSISRLVAAQQRGRGGVAAADVDYMSSIISSSQRRSYFHYGRTINNDCNNNYTMNSSWHGTTILCIRKNGRVCMMGDGQVSMGSMTVKPNAKKIRRIPSKVMKNSGHLSSHGGGESTTTTNSSNDTLVGFAGSTADAFTLLERLEGKLDEHPGQLARSCVELAKGWRTDKYLRRLEASLVVADDKISLELTGNGDVLESNDGVLGVGSGNQYALAAARALMDIPELSAEEVATKAMEIASDMCVYTNKEFMMEVIMDTSKENEEKKRNMKDDDEVE